MNDQKIKERWIVLVADKDVDVVGYYCMPFTTMVQFFASVEEARSHRSLDDAESKKFVGWILNIDTGRTEPL